MSEPDPELAREAMFEVVENQMRDGDPPETKQTYERLIGDGHSHDESMRMIACVLSNEMFHMLKGQETFDQARFVAGLDALPEMPWAEDED